MAVSPVSGLWQEADGALLYHAKDYRRFMERILQFDTGNTVEGYFKTGDLVVSERASGGANMSVDVAAGACAVDGDENTHQGAYFIFNDAVTNVVITAAHATLGRRDIIGVRVQDKEYSGSVSTATLVAVAGTPNAVPVDPAYPSNFMPLARVTVGAAVSSIVNANIADLRVKVTPPGGVLICTSSTRPTASLTEGLMIYETDTHKLMQYTTATTLWTPPWNLPWGQLAYAEITADVSQATGGPNNVAGLSITFTPVANRRVRISIGGGYVSHGYLLIREGGTTLNYHRQAHEVGAADVAIGLPAPSVVITPTAASHTYVGSTFSYGGASPSVDAGTDHPVYIMAEDLGPAAAPA